MSEVKLDEKVEDFGEPVWIAEGILQIGRWMACFDPSGELYWDHLHGDGAWAPVSLESESTLCQCGEEVPVGIVTMSHLQKLNPKSRGLKTGE